MLLSSEFRCSRSAAETGASLGADLPATVWGAPQVSLSGRSAPSARVCRCTSERAPYAAAQPRWSSLGGRAPQRARRSGQHDRCSDGLARRQRAGGLPQSSAARGAGSGPVRAAPRRWCADALCTPRCLSLFPTPTSRRSAAPSPLIALVAHHRRSHPSAHSHFIACLAHLAPLGSPRRSSRPTLAPSGQRHIPAGSACSTRVRAQPWHRHHDTRRRPRRPHPVRAAS